MPSSTTASFDPDAPPFVPFGACSLLPEVRPSVVTQTALDPLHHAERAEPSTSAADQEPCHKDFEFIRLHHCDCCWEALPKTCFCSNVSMASYFTCVEVAQPPRAAFAEPKRIARSEPRWCEAEPKRPPSAYFIFTKEDKDKLVGVIPSNFVKTFAKT